MKSLTQKEMQNKITNYFHLLFKSYTVEIQDFNPFIIAFTKNHKDHQFKKLETLGDRILEMIVSELLIESEKKNSYKDMFHLKSFFVSDEMNSHYCNQLGIKNEFPNLSYSRVFEVFLAGLHQNIGYEKTKDWFKIKLFDANLEEIQNKYKKMRSNRRKIKVETRKMNNLVQVKGSRKLTSQLYWNLINYCLSQNNLNPITIKTQHDENHWQTQVIIKELTSLQGNGQSNIKPESISLAIIDLLNNLLFQYIEK